MNVHRGYSTIQCHLSRRGAAQMTQLEVRKTKKIANLRILAWRCGQVSLFFSKRFSYLFPYGCTVQGNKFLESVFCGFQS